MILLQNYRRIDLKGLKLPNVIQVHSVENVEKIPRNIFNGIERGVLLPLSDRNCSNIFLSSQHFAGIVVNKKFFFNSDDIDVCKNIHHIKEVQSKLEKETAWFKRAKKARVPCSSLEKTTCAPIGPTLVF